MGFNHSEVNLICLNTYLSAGWLAGGTWMAVFFVNKHHRLTRNPIIQNETRTCIDRSHWEYLNSKMEHCGTKFLQSKQDSCWWHKVFTVEAR